MLGRSDSGWPWGSRIRSQIRMVSGMGFDNGVGSFSDGFLEGYRFLDDSVSLPTQDPTLDFAEAGKMKAEEDSAVFKLGNFFGRMPLLFADIVGDAAIETNLYVVRFGAGMYPETISQSFFQAEIGGASEGFSGKFDGEDSSGREGANAGAGVAVGKEKPFAVHIG